MNEIKSNTYYTFKDNAPYISIYYTTHNAIYFYLYSLYTKGYWQKSIYKLLELQKELDSGRLIELPYMNTALYQLLNKDMICPYT